MRALIVDETEHVSTRLGESLRHAGYGVEEAHARGEALWLAGAQRPDVVIVCANRPGTTELRTVTALRDDGESAPILVMAARHDVGATVAALDAGADDVVSSPVSLGEVAARLRALARRPRTVEPAILEVGSLRLDQSEQAAWRLDAATHARCDLMLKRRELLVLEVLMGRPGRITPRSTLLEAVWGVGAEVTSNVVDQSISRLRSTIDRPFGLRDLETVRGVGYRILDSAASSLDAA